VIIHPQGPIAFKILIQ